jgi:DNA-binding XRE family transcriptional regulator
MTQDDRSDGSGGGGADRNQPEPNGTRPWDAVCGGQLAQLLGLRRLRQKALAERLGVDPRTVFNWKKGEDAPNAINKAELIHVLGGRADPVWDAPEFRELALALGARRPELPAVGVVNGVHAATADPPDPPPAPAPASDQGAIPPPPPSGGPRWRWLLPGLAGLVVLLVLGGLRLWPLVHPADELVDVIPSATGPWRLVYASGRVTAVPMTARNGAFSWNCGDRDVPTRHLFRDLDGHTAALVVSLDAASPQSPTGQLRVDRFTRDASHPAPGWLDDAPQYGGTSYSSTVWSLQAVLFLDWDGDGRQDVVVVGTHTFFPSVLAVFDATPRRLRTYAHAGQIRRVIPVPPDLVPVQPRVEGVTRTTRTRGVALALSVEYNDAPRCAGLVLLPTDFANGANPVSDTAHRHDTLPVLETARDVRFLPSLAAQRCPAGHNWPEQIHYDPATQQFQLGTLEEPEGEGVIRYLDESLRQVAVVPTDRFRHKYPQLQAQYHLPPFTSAAMTTSFETLDYWQDGIWHSVRVEGAWKP